MMSRERESPPRETRETRRYGVDVTIRNFWIRHAQKISGRVFAEEAGAISSSSISPYGAASAYERGEDITALRDGAKAYVSDSARTAETVNHILDGYTQNNPGVERRRTVIADELSVVMPQEFAVRYNELFEEQKNKLMAELGFTDQEFDALTPGEQEQVAERAEEPIVREWLDQPESEPAQRFPPRDAAARFAVLFDLRHERMAEKLYSSSEVDLFHVTHKTITEAFLSSGVLIRRSDGERITSIAALGGSLGTLGEWQSEVRTNEQGQGTTTVRLRGEEYDIDAEALETLIRHGLKQRKESEKEV